MAELAHTNTPTYKVLPPHAGGHLGHTTPPQCLIVDNRITSGSGTIDATGEGSGRKHRRNIRHIRSFSGLISLLWRVLYTQLGKGGGRPHKEAYIGDTCTGAERQ